MITKEAIKLFRDYLRLNHRKRTIESYSPLLEKYEAAYADQALDSIGSDEIYHFLETVTQHLSKSTRRLRYAQMKAFYNFIIDRCVAEHEESLQYAVAQEILPCTEATTS